MLPEHKNKATSQHVFCNCSKCNATTGKFDYNINGENTIMQRLKDLPQVAARPGFDQRMAAAFALELENEIAQKNSAWLRKNKKILLPGLIANSGNELL